MSALEVVAELPPEIARVTDYGHGGPADPGRAMPSHRFWALCGSRLVVHEGTEVRYCERCGADLRVWRFAVDPPDAYGETAEGARYWAAREWVVAPCEPCWLERDPEAALKHRRDLSRMRRGRDRLIERRVGADRDVVIYSPETEED